MPPALITLASEAHYRDHFRLQYCSGPITTHDGIPVRFHARKFDHCCYDSSRRDGNKDTFSLRRAERLDWIAAVLQDPAIPLHFGWDNKRKVIDFDRRVAVLRPDYAVIIRRLDAAWSTCEFTTAFVIDDPTIISLMLAKPQWTR